MRCKESVTSGYSPLIAVSTLRPADGESCSMVTTPAGNLPSPRSPDTQFVAKLSKIAHFPGFRIAIIYL